MWIEYLFIGVMAFMSLLGLYVFLERYFYIRKLKLSKYTNRFELEKDLTRGLYILASVASNAPYVGLLGTVLGIMQTFYTMGREGIGDTLRIMVGLSLALKATALGLLVAVPATILYNFLVRRVKEAIYDWEAENGRKGD
ncbi:MAG: TonB-system energizer ExbB [Aquificaceae bacterium]